MADTVSKQTRSRLMSSVKNKNTAPELNIRKALFARGLRYRLHNRKLPGAPDLVFPRYKAVIFIHGCFWHNHDCKHGRLPATNRPFWTAKLQGNAARDQQTMRKLNALGWRICIIWACSLKNKRDFFSDSHIEELIAWLVKVDGEPAIPARKTEKV